MKKVALVFMLAVLPLSSAFAQFSLAPPQINVTGNVQDPEFKGRKLSAWLADAHFGMERMHVISPEMGKESAEARTAILEMGTNLIPVLLDWMRIRQPRMEFRQGQAASTLLLFGLEARFAIPELIEMLNDPNSQMVAASVLSRFGADAKPALPKLIELLKKPGENRIQLVYAVSALGANAVEAIPVFIELFKEPKNLCVAAADALPRIGVAAVAPLAWALTNSDQRLHFGAAMSLNQIVISGLVPSVAVPALIVALKDPDQEVRLHAARALARIRSPEAERAMLANLSDPDVEVRRVILFFLTDFKQDPAELIPKLSYALTNADQELHYSAAVGLGRLCQSYTNADVVSAAVLALTKALKDQDEQLRLAAVNSLVGIRSPEAVLALLERLTGARMEDRSSLSGTDDSVRSHILLAIASLNYDPNVILRVLTQLEDDPSASIRHDAHIVSDRIKARQSAAIQSK